MMLSVRDLLCQFIVWWWCRFGQCTHTLCLWWLLHNIDKANRLFALIRSYSLLLALAAGSLFNGAYSLDAPRVKRREEQTRPNKEHLLGLSWSVCELFGVSRSQAQVVHRLCVCMNASRSNWPPSNDDDDGCCCCRCCVIVERDKFEVSQLQWTLLSTVAGFLHPPPSSGSFLSQHWARPFTTWDAIYFMSAVIFYMRRHSLQMRQHLILLHN